MKTRYYTAEGLAKLKEELIFLEEKEMPLIARLIGEASSQGDLKENAEYHAAKGRQNIVSLRIKRLKEELSQALVLDQAHIDTSQVGILTTVRLKDLEQKKELVYTLVSEREVDMRAGKISINSPIGQGLLGKKVGEKAVISMPSPLAGRRRALEARSFEIISIEV